VRPFLVAALLIPVHGLLNVAAFGARRIRSG